MVTSEQEAVLARLPLPPGPGPIATAWHLSDYAITGNKERVIGTLVERFGNLIKVGPYVLLVGPKANELLLASGPEVVRPFDDDDFPSLASTDGEVHTRDRRVVMAAFQRPCLAGYVRDMEAMLARRVAGWGESIDLHAEMSELAVETLALTMLGIEPATVRYRAFVADYWPLIFRYELNVRPPWRVRAVRASKSRMWSLLRQLVRERRQKPGNDALSAMITGNEQNTGVSVGEDDLVRFAYMLLDFGQGDIAVFLTYLLTILSGDEHLRARLEAERESFSTEAALAPSRHLPFTINLLREVERLYTPVSEVHRIAVKDLEFEGHRIPRGSRLVSSIFHGHRMAEHFAYPLRFDPDRFAAPREEHKTPFALMGFGSGRHMCVAAMYCRMHAAVVLHHLFQQVELTRFDTRPVPEVDYRGTLQAPGRPIRMRVRRRSGPRSATPSPTPTSAIR